MRVLSMLLGVLLLSGCPGQESALDLAEQAASGARRLEVNDTLRATCAGYLIDYEILQRIMVFETDRQNGWSYAEQMMMGLGRCDSVGLFDSVFGLTEEEQLTQQEERTAEQQVCGDCVVAILDQVHGR